MQIYYWGFSMKKIKNEDQKTSMDFSNKSWFMDNNNIKIGESFQKIMSGESQTLDINEILVGDPFQTFKIVLTKDEKIYLLKSSRELK